MATTHDHGGGVRRLLLQVKKMWQQVTRRKSTRHTRDHVPNDVIVEILLRLPAKSLLRLRWTCKYWFDLITRDDDYIKMHLHRSTTHDNEILSIISTSRQCISCWNIDYSKTDTHGYNVSSELNAALGFEYPKILGSCNGLILLGEEYPGKKNLCILNPCTKEYKILPNPLSKVKLPLGENYGFGYDHTIDDYKVIRKTYYLVDNNQCSDFEVYTLGTNSWRMIELKQRTRAFMKTVFVNGFLYWMDNLLRHINSFDIEKEEQFHNVPKVPKFVNRFWHDMQLEVFEGSLCAVIRVRDQQVYREEIWVMNNNNNNETLWTKLSTIPDLQDSEFPVKPIRYTKNGEILMLNYHNDVSFFDPKNNKDRTTLGRIFEYRRKNLVKEATRIFEFPSLKLIKEVYIETLVSLNSGTYTVSERREEQNKLQQQQENVMRAWRNWYL